MPEPYTPLANPSSWRRLALGTWRKPNDSTVYATIEVDVTEALRLIARLRQTHRAHVTLTHLVVKALATALARFPDGNGLIIGHRVYLRKEVDIFCQVASEDGRDLSGVKISRADQRPLVEIASELNARAERIRARQDLVVERSKRSLDRVPASVLGLAMRLVELLTYNLRLDLTRFGIAYDQFGSAMVTSVGAIDASLGFAVAPLVPFSHVPIVVLVPNVQQRPAVVGDRVVPRPILTLGCTFDHRFVDGVIGARIAQTLRNELLEPERLV